MSNRNTTSVAFIIDFSFFNLFFPCDGFTTLQFFICCGCFSHSTHFEAVLFIHFVKGIHWSRAFLRVSFNIPSLSEMPNKWSYPHTQSTPPKRHCWLKCFIQCYVEVRVHALEGVQPWSAYECALSKWPVRHSHLWASNCVMHVSVLTKMMFPSGELTSFQPGGRALCVPCSLLVHTQACDCFTVFSDATGQLKVTWATLENNAVTFKILQGWTSAPKVFHHVLLGLLTSFPLFKHLFKL